jgi:hypothetical protein
VNTAKKNNDASLGEISPSADLRSEQFIGMLESRMSHRNCSMIQF